jgi:aminotransferase
MLRGAPRNESSGWSRHASNPPKLLITKDQFELNSTGPGLNNSVEESEATCGTKRALTMEEVFLTGRRMDRVPYAGIRKAFEKANELAARGVRVIHFEIGRPDFDTPLNIKEAAKSALDQGIVHYAPNAGVSALREALADSVKEHKGVDYKADKEIIVTAGGQEALYLTFMSILDPGDEVLIPNPAFGTFPSAVHLAGGIPVAIDLVPSDNFMFDLEAAAKVITPRTKAMIVNSPHNPTGSVLTREQLETIAVFATQHNLILVSDEAYDRMVYDGHVHHSPASLPGMRERTIICGSLSKTYAMTGWRIGYIAAPESVVDAATRVQQNVMLSLCAFAQMGAIAGLTQSQSFTEEMMQEFTRRRKLMLEMLKQVAGLELESVPKGTFYLFPKITLPGISSAQLADHLLESAGIAVIDGAVFGSNGDGHLRISYASSYDNCKEGMERLAVAMSKLAAGTKAVAR